MKLCRADGQNGHRCKRVAGWGTDHKGTGRCRDHGRNKTPKKTPNQKRCISPRSGYELIPGNPGNSGGKLGRSGPKPNEFKVFCNELLKDPDVQLKMLTAAQGGDLKPVEVAAKYTQKLPSQTIEHEGGDRPIQVSHTEKLLTRIDRMAANRLKHSVN